MKNAITTFLLAALLSVVPAVAEDAAVAADAADNPCSKGHESIKCVEYIREKAGRGDAEAQYQLGAMYYNGNGITKDKSEALRWYRKAAEQGHVLAGVAVGGAPNPCTGPTSIECVEYTREKAERGDAEAQTRLGDMYRDLFGFEVVEKDSGKAVLWYRAAANQEYVKAQNKLGGMYRYGLGVEKDAGEAARWYRLAVEQGDVEAQYQLGLMYFQGKGVAKDFREAVRLFRAATENTENMKNYSLLSSSYWINLAQYQLGLMYYNGEGVAKDFREALRLFRAAAEQGNAKTQKGNQDAQNILGLMYYKGEGVEKDVHEAVRWYHLAAEQGNADAKYKLGLMYYKGEEVEKDFHEVVRLFQTLWVNEDARIYLLKAKAELGDAEAQYELGWRYSLGKGVEKDKRESARWERAAAEQGHAKAQYGLGLRYAIGVGVVEDYREAYIWLLIAKASGVEEADKTLRRNTLKKYLTSTDIQYAQREASRRFKIIENRKNNAESSDNNSAGNAGAGLSVATPPQQKNIAAEVFEKTWRSVVMIEDSDGQGGGVIIRPNLVATNCHVVEGGGSIAVYKPQNRQIKEDAPFYAKVVHRNKTHDFCILEVKGLWGIAAQIRKYDTLKVGENVYALGAPHGLDLSLFNGLISQLRTTDDGVRFIQTDAAISPGSSGGGLFDVEGNFIGILTSKRIEEGTEGIGFAIPADLSLEF